MPPSVLSSLLIRRLRKRPSRANSSAARGELGRLGALVDAQQLEHVRQPGQRADLLEQPPAGHEVAALDGQALVEPLDAAGAGRTRRGARGRSRRSPRAAGARAPRARGPPRRPRTRPCRAAVADRRGQVADPRDRRLLAGQRGPAQRRRRHRLGGSDARSAPRPRSAGRPTTTRARCGRSARPPRAGSPAPARRRCASCRIDVDLVLEQVGVVGADLGAEAVLERSDDPAAVGVVLGVRAGHQQHVERQPQVVAADLDVALLQHVEQRHLDPLGEVGQLVDREDAAVACAAPGRSAPSRGRPGCGPRRP